MSIQIDDPLYAARQEMLERVRDAIGGSQSRADALRLALDVVGTPVGWHEAEVVAEALRHRYDDLVAQQIWISIEAWNDPVCMTSLRREMRRRLVLEADGRGLSLVEDPVEWLYAAPPGSERFKPAAGERGRTPLTAAQVAALPSHYYVLVKLVGHGQKLNPDA